MPCWVAIAPLMDSTTGWRHTEFTGRYPKTIRSPHRSITSAKAVKRSIVGPRARSRWPFPCGASGSDRCASRSDELRPRRGGLLLVQVDERAFLVADDDVGQPVAVDVRGDYLRAD